MKALILDAEERTAHVKEVPAPRQSLNELLIHVKAVALNPIDSLYVFNPLGSTGRTIGSDFAGVIDAVGDAVPLSSGLKRGDRVAGFLQGACSVNERPGAFANYLVCPWDLVWKVRDGTRLEEAAAVSLCGLTAAQALFFRMGLQAPFDWHGEMEMTAGTLNPTSDPNQSSVSVFIYGATTSVGSYAAQLVRRSADASGKTVKLYGTAGSKHFKRLKAESYRYNDLVDYHDNDWPAKIRSLTQGQGVDYAYDCISEGETVSDTSKTLAPHGKLAIVRSREGGAWTAQDLPVEPSYGAVWEGLGEVVQYQGMILPVSHQARAFAVAFYKWLSEGGKLEPNPLREMPGGMESIVSDGFRLLGSGIMGDRNVASEKTWMKPLSGEKMVYKMGTK